MVQSKSHDKRKQYDDSSVEDTADKDGWFKKIGTPDSPKQTANNSRYYEQPSSSSSSQKSPSSSSVPTVSDIPFDGAVEGSCGGSTRPVSQARTKTPASSGNHAVQTNGKKRTRKTGGDFGFLKEAEKRPATRRGPVEASTSVTVAGCSQRSGKSRMIRRDGKAGHDGTGKGLATDETAKRVANSTKLNREVDYADDGDENFLRSGGKPVDTQDRPRRKRPGPCSLQRTVDGINTPPGPSRPFNSRKGRTKESSMKNSKNTRRHSGHSASLNGRYRPHPGIVPRVRQELSGLAATGMPSTLKLSKAKRTGEYLPTPRRREADRSQVVVRKAERDMMRRTNGSVVDLVDDDESHPQKRTNYESKRYTRDDGRKQRREPMKGPVTKPTATHSPSLTGLNLANTFSKNRITNLLSPSSGGGATLQMGSGTGGSSGVKIPRKKGLLNKVLVSSGSGQYGELDTEVRKNHKKLGVTRQNMYERIGSLVGLGGKAQEGSTTQVLSDVEEKVQGGRNRRGGSFDVTASKSGLFSAQYGIPAGKFHQKGTDREDVCTPKTRSQPRRSSRVRRIYGRSSTHVEILLSSGDESGSENSFKDDSKASSSKLKIGVSRIAIGKRVFKSSCSMTLEYHGMIVLGYKNIYEEQKHIQLDFDGGSILEVKYFLGSTDVQGKDSFHDKESIRPSAEKDRVETEDEDIDAFLAIRVTPDQRNGLRAYRHYAPTPRLSLDAEDFYKSYLVIEMRTQDELQELLGSMSEFPFLKPYFTKNCEILSGAGSYVQALVNDSRTEKEKRLRSRPASSRGFEENKLVLVYPFDGYENLINAEIFDNDVICGVRTENNSDSNSIEKNSECSNYESSKAKTLSSDRKRHYLTIMSEDVGRLGQGEYLNDTLIDFYLQW
eukprot:CAMPEP_0194286440 /NCGR_PEP_ID=MMETSP0169-20130528/32556_1 /TAXON_ID=218684 /ORGANISM="Corethron pennatum, Strain L29A3" /LENGTH=891 /DNA_ID=CAMNT_0039032873 /DNA_START=36 /DNA_END=2708 /DNA_ORIENTATION=+